MNKFLQCLNDENLLNVFIKDKEDISFLESLKNIRVEKKESKQGKINKLPYFNWFAEYEGVEYPLNLSRTNKYLVDRTVNTYCKSCGKFIGKRRLSDIFQLKYSDISKINHQNPLECKHCAARNNAINGQEKSKQTCLKHFGVEYSFQSENNRRKTIETKIRKYGKNWKKIQAGWMYGSLELDENGKLLNHNGYNPETRKKMIEGWKRTVSQKPIEEIQKWRAKIIRKNNI